MKEVLYVYIREYDDPEKFRKDNKFKDDTTPVTPPPPPPPEDEDGEDPESS